MGKVIEMPRPKLEGVEPGTLTEDQEVELFLESTDGLINLIDEVSDRLRLPKFVVVESFIASLDEIRSRERRPTNMA